MKSTKKKIKKITNVKTKRSDEAHIFSSSIFSFFVNKITSQVGKERCVIFDAFFLLGFYKNFVKNNKTKIYKNIPKQQQQRWSIHVVHIYPSEALPTTFFSCNEATYHSHSISHTSIYSPTYTTTHKLTYDT